MFNTNKLNALERSRSSEKDESEQGENKVEESRLEILSANLEEINLGKKEEEESIAKVEGVLGRLGEEGEKFTEKPENSMFLKNFKGKILKNKAVRATLIGLSLYTAAPELAAAVSFENEKTAPITENFKPEIADSMVESLLSKIRDLSVDSEKDETKKGKLKNQEMEYKMENNLDVENQLSQVGETELEEKKAQNEVSNKSSVESQFPQFENVSLVYQEGVKQVYDKASAENKKLILDILSEEYSFPDEEEILNSSGDPFRLVQAQQVRELQLEKGMKDNESGVRLPFDEDYQNKEEVLNRESSNPEIFDINNSNNEQIKNWLNYVKSPEQWLADIKRWDERNEEGWQNIYPERNEVGNDNE